MYNILKRLPLFQGLGSSEIEDIVAQVRFGFYQYKKGQHIIRSDENCRGLVYLIQGEMEITTTGGDNSFRLTELVSAPYIIEPERVYGLRQRFSLTYTASSSSCGILFVRKDEVTRLSTDYLVFRMNMLNILSTIAQRRAEKMMPAINTAPEDKLVRFLDTITCTPTWPKTLRIRMTTLAAYLSLSRLEVSVELNRLDKEGRIRLQRGMITFYETFPPSPHIRASEAGTP
ncbi:MAG: Crp/Fnr family transcriptional regulator [Prevotella sp.]